MFLDQAQSNAGPNLSCPGDIVGAVSFAPYSQHFALFRKSRCLLICKSTGQILKALLFVLQYHVANSAERWACGTGRVHVYRQRGWS